MDTRMISISRDKGFSMVELMLTLVVAAVLTAIAVPMYTAHVIKTNRTALQTEMTQIAQKLANFKLANNSYAAALSSSTIYGGSTYPRTGTSLYSLSLDTTTVVGAWTLTATPTSGAKQANDGAVLLNDQGWRCWSKTTPCTLSTLSATSNWDGR